MAKSDVLQALSSSAAFPWASCPSCMTNIFHREGKAAFFLAKTKYFKRYND
jgi:hypothetical protein